MNFKSSTLSSFLTEIVFSATTESQIEPLVLYHYTNDEAKNKIVDEERQTVTLRLPGSEANASSPVAYRIFT